MTVEAKNYILDQIALLADQGLRVLAIARKSTADETLEHSDVDRTSIKKNLTFLGLAGLMTRLA